MCPEDYPVSTPADPYTDTSISIKTVKDLRCLIDGLPDDVRVYLYGVALDTVHNMEGDVKNQECIEHSGYKHRVFGVIFQLEG